MKPNIIYLFNPIVVNLQIVICLFICLIVCLFVCLCVLILMKIDREVAKSPRTDIGKAGDTAVQSTAHQLILITMDVRVDFIKY